MEFMLTAEQEELRSVVRRFVDSRSPESAVRKHMASERGYDTSLWRSMATDLGLQSLTIPKEFGGSASSAVDLAVVTAELGRGLVCAPFLSMSAWLPTPRQE